MFFNELSIEEKESIDGETVLAFAQIYQALRKYDITTCRIDSKDNHKLHQMIQMGSNFLNIRNFSFFRSPYESEMVEIKQNLYLEHEWSYHGKPCIGFPLAIILNSATLSIYEKTWNEPFIHIMKDGDIDIARNICTKQHIDIHIPQIQSDQEPELIECNLRAEDKEIVLRDDHGIDDLTNFSKRLIRCPYVIKVVNSLPFNSHERKFIRRIRENGLIEIVLPWTDKGYGIVVKTTGRTFRETERIGEIIEEKYGGI